MPIFIPVIIGAAVLGSAVAGGGMALNAKGRIKKAKAMYEAAHSLYNEKRESLKAYSEGTEKRLQELGTARAEAMKVILEAIAFIRKAKLTDPNIISDAEVRLENLDELDRVYESVLKSLAGAGAGIAGGVGTGAMTALGAYGLVGALGTASTGAAIGGLSGAAATSATLAWFGGGALAAGGLGIVGGTAVLGGIAAAPVFIALGAFTQHKAGKLEKEVEEAIKKIKLEEAKIGREQAKLQATRQRVEELGRTIRELTQELRTALKDAVHSNSEDIYRVVQLAKSLRVAIDEPAIPLDNRPNGSHISNR